MLSCLVKKYFFSLLLAIVLSSSAYGKLGDTIAESMARWGDGAEDVQAFTLSQDIVVAIFKYPTGEIGCAYLDGVCEIETYVDSKDQPATTSPEFVPSLLGMFSPKWQQIDKSYITGYMPDVIGFQSVDGEYFMLYGRLPHLNCKHGLTIYTKKWATRKPTPPNFIDI